MICYVHYVWFLNLWPIASSVTSTKVTAISPNITSELYNITVICTVHAESTADHCVLMAMADGRVTRSGKQWVYYKYRAILLLIKPHNYLYSTVMYTLFRK